MIKTITPILTPRNVGIYGRTRRETMGSVMENFSTSVKEAYQMTMRLIEDSRFSGVNYVNLCSVYQLSEIVLYVHACRAYGKSEIETLDLINARYGTGPTRYSTDSIERIAQLRAEYDACMALYAKMDARYFSCALTENESVDLKSAKDSVWAKSRTLFADLKKLYLSKES